MLFGWVGNSNGIGVIYWVIAIILLILGISWLLYSLRFDVPFDNLFKYKSDEKR